MQIKTTNDTCWCYKVKGKTTLTQLCRIREDGVCVSNLKKKNTEKGKKLGTMG